MKTLTLPVKQFLRGNLSVTTTLQVGSFQYNRMLFQSKHKTVINGLIISLYKNYHMKTILYTLILVILLGSCNTLNKMVERGEYDNAIIYATEKLAGKRKKKTKYVKALEEAFVRITTRDMKRIEFLNGQDNPEHWDEIYNIAGAIEYRQERIDPFLPLTSKDGYQAAFKFVDTYKLKNLAKDGAAEFHYQNGIRLLSLSKDRKDKKYAREAYSSFEKVRINRLNYKDVSSLMLEARTIGEVNILVEVINNSNMIVPAHFESRIKNISVTSLNNLWRKYHIDLSSKDSYDYVAEMEITEISMSPERETITHHEDSKRIEDGVRTLKDDRGRVLRDTTGKKLTEKKFKRVYATVTEIHREKTVSLSGIVLMKNTITSDMVQSRPINVQAVFNDYASSYVGDRRAVCKNDVGRLKPYSQPFPDDSAMIIDVGENLKGAFKSALAKMPI